MLDGFGLGWREMRNLVLLLLLLVSVSVGAPVSYPVPGGTAYRSNTGQIAVDPGDGLQTFNAPAMGMYQDKFIPFAVNSLGQLMTAGGGVASNVQIFDSAGNPLTSTAGALNVNATVTFPPTISVTQGTTPWVVSGTVNIGNFPATQDVNVTNPTLAVTQSGTWTTGRTWTLSSGTDSVSASVSNFPALQSVNLTQIGGATPSATNWVPARVTNGVSYVDPTQIRALSSATDSVTVEPGVSPLNVAQSGTWTTGRTWTLNSGTDSVSVVFPGTISVTQGTTPWVVSGTVIADQGGAALPANAWYTRITDGSTTVGVTAFSLNVNVTNTVPISGTITANQGTSPWVVSGTVAATQSGTWTTGRTWTLSSGTDSISASVSNFPATQAVTQSTSPWVVSGTVTANIGTTGGLALDTSVNGILRAQGSTTSGQTGPLIQGAVTTSAPSYTTAQTSPLSLTTSGLLRVDASGATIPISGTITANQGTSPWVVSGTVAATQSGTWTTGRTWSLSSGTDSVAAVQSGSWSVTATQGTSPWVTNVSQFGGSNVVTGTGASGSGIPRVTVSNDSNILATQSGTWTTGRTWTLASGTDSVAAVQSGTWTVQQGTPPWQVVGNVASAATDSGNPVKGAGVFNTTQPTVTNGQRVDFQSTARGGLIVSTGVDNFTVQQGSAPWSVSQSGTWNINNISGTISLPTGAATSANQTNASQKTQIVDGAGTVIGAAQTISAVNYLPVILPASATSGSAIPGRAVLVAGSDGTNARNLATDTSGNLSVVGNVASAASDSGNPVKVGAKFNTSAPTFTNGQRGDLQIDASGNLKVTAVSSLGATTQTSQPTATGNNTAVSQSADAYGVLMQMPMEAALSLWGKMFAATTGFINTASSSEAALIYINNPNASGVTMKVKRITFSGSSAAGDIIPYAIYKTPTVTANGTTLTPVGLRQTNQATAAVQLFTQPTTSSFGTKVLQYNQETQAGTLQVDYGFDFWVEANNKYLITVTQAGTGATKATSVSLEYAEQ